MCGKVATGVHLVVHVERCILAVAQIVLGIGVVDATCNILFVFVPRPYLLAFFSVDDGCSGVLAEGELSLACHFSVAEEGKCHILVVFAGFRITQNLCHLFVVATAQFEADVVEGLVHEQSETLSLNFQYGVSFEVADADIVLGQQAVFGLVLAELEHRRIAEFRCLCHIVLVLYVNLREWVISSLESMVQGGFLPFDSQCICAWFC